MSEGGKGGGRAAAADGATAAAAAAFGKQQRATAAAATQTQTPLARRRSLIAECKLLSAPLNLPDLEAYRAQLPKCGVIP